MNVIEEISLRREDIVNTKQDKLSLNKIAVRKGTKPLQRGGLESFQRAGIISGYNRSWNANRTEIVFSRKMCYT